MVNKFVGMAAAVASVAGLAAGAQAGEKKVAQKAPAPIERVADRDDLSTDQKCAHLDRQYDKTTSLKQRERIYSANKSLTDYCVAARMENGKDGFKGDAPHWETTLTPDTRAFYRTVRVNIGGSYAHIEKSGNSMNGFSAKAEIEKDIAPRVSVFAKGEWTSSVDSDTITNTTTYGPGPYEGYEWNIDQEASFDQLSASLGGKLKVIESDALDLTAVGSVGYAHRWMEFQENGSLTFNGNEVDTLNRKTKDDSGAIIFSAGAEIGSKRVLGENVKAFVEYEHGEGLNGGEDHDIIRGGALYKFPAR